MRKRVVGGLFFCLLGLSAGVIGCQKNEWILTFPKAEAPTALYLNESVFQSTGRFFAVKNGDADSLPKLLAYSFASNEPQELVYEMKKSAGKIRDTVVTNSFLAFSTLFLQENSLYMGIYAYHLPSKRLKEVKVIPISAADLYPLQLCSDGQRLAWLEQSQKERITRIVSCSLKTGRERVLREFPFTDEGYGFATFVLAMHGGNLYYDCRNNERSVLRVMSLETGEDFFEIELPKSVVVNTALRVRSDKEGFFLSGKTERGTLLYEVDRTGTQVREVAVFPQTEKPVDGQMVSDGNELLYAVERYNPEGKMPFYACWQSMSEDAKKIIPGAYAVVLTPSYRGVLLLSEKGKTVQFRLSQRQSSRPF